jgi:predicted permease
MPSDLRFRLRSLFRRKPIETDTNQELCFHFEREVEKGKNARMTNEEATRQARLAFGGHEQVKEDCREACGTNLVETVLQDIRSCLRAYRKSPGFFLIAVLTLTLGIGASIAVFSLVNTILLKPLPYPNADRVVMAWRSNHVNSLFGSVSFPWSSTEYQFLTQSEKTFQHLSAFKKDGFNLTGLANPELLEGVRASADFFPTLGAPPILGRTFTADEDQPGHEFEVVLSYRLWKSRFGGNSRVVGSVIHLNGFPYTVVGVMPLGFSFPTPEGMPTGIDVPKQTQLWVPLALPLALRPGPSDLEVVGELKSDVSLARASEDLHAFDQRWLENFPNWKGWFSTVLPLRQQTVADAQRPLLLLLGAVCVFLLIACSNVAGLMLNRSLGRCKEFTLRGALGARRSRLVGQLMTESLILAGTGGTLGTILGEASFFLLKHFGIDSISRLHQAGLDLRVSVFAVGITLITGIFFGLAPALGSTRTDLAQALKEGGQRSGASASAPRIRNMLQISQVALSLVLVTASGLLVRTFYHLLCSNTGFDATHVVTFELPLPNSKYSDTDRVAQIYRQILQQLQSTPGVESAGFASVVAMGGPTDSTDIRIPGMPRPQLGSQTPLVNYIFISSRYFASIGTPFQYGRDIADSDTLSTMPVTIINSAMATKYWPGQNPIGKQVGVGAVKYPLRTIIGVVADVKQVSLREVPSPAMYVPYTQNEIKTWPSMQAMQFAIRTLADPDAVAAGVRDAVHAVDSDLPIANYVTLTNLVRASMTADRFTMLLLVAFGVLALILAAIGMYGVISYSVMQRTPEIGVRIALGARRSQIFIMVLQQGGSLACVGIVIGLIAAFMTTRLMTRFLYGVQPTDPVTLVAVSLLLIAVALLACSVPAHKAMKVDPMVALRYE